MKDLRDFVESLNDEQKKFFIALYYSLTIEEEEVEDGE